MVGGDSTSTGVKSALTRGELAVLDSWFVKAGVPACPGEGWVCRRGVRGEDTKLAAAGERWQTAPLLQSRRPEGAPPEVILLAFSSGVASLRCSTGEDSIPNFGLEINQSNSLCDVLNASHPTRFTQSN